MLRKLPFFNLYQAAKFPEKSGVLTNFLATES